MPRHATAGRLYHACAKAGSIERVEGMAVRRSPRVEHAQAQRDAG